MTGPVYEVVEHGSSLRLRVMVDGREVFGDDFTSLDDQKASKMAEEIARRLGLPQDDGVSTVRIILRIWDEFARAPNARTRNGEAVHIGTLHGTDDYGHTAPVNFMQAADMISKGLTPAGYLEIDPDSKRAQRKADRQRRIREAL